MNQPWGRSERSLSIFISSPSDAAAEREVAERVVEEVGRSVGEILGISLRVKRWERFRPRGGNIMNYIQDQLSTCDLFVMIFSRRFGSSPSPGSEYTSGTEQEYRIAAKLHDDSSAGRPEMFVYFQQITDRSVLNDPGPELSKVLKFKEEVERTRFYRQYAASDIFGYQFREHLIEWLLEMAQRLRRDEELDRKRAALQRFFRLGSPPDERTSALILYPWLERLGGDITHLLPYMVLEDFQAIHKITKCLNIAGCDRVHASSTNEYNRQRDRNHNKIFVCWRNTPGQEHLNGVQDRRFSLETRREGEREVRSILWRNEAGRETRVHSPQSIYLSMQRSPGGKWKGEPGKCVSVDFAVLARFLKPDENISEVYVIGIRGLGTWGAAWYLDRRWSEPGICGAHESAYQGLLKVTYRNHRIHEVEDVSGQSEEFFKSEVDPETISRTIKTLSVGEPAMATGAGSAR